MPPSPATHWARSDDLGEYHGLYLYSQTPDGRLWRMNYPDNHTSCPEEAKHIGYWEMSTTAISWTDMARAHTNTFLMNTNGYYVEQDGHYYVPVKLIPYRVIAGRPAREEDAQQGGGAYPPPAARLLQSKSRATGSGSAHP